MNAFRLQRLADDLEKFERDANELQAWLTSAKSRAHILQNVDEVDDEDLPSLGVISTQLQHLLDLRKDIEAKAAHKSQLLTLGTQLLRSRPRDVTIKHKMDDVSDKWSQLIGELPETEQQLHEAQMEQLPMRQALADVDMWLDAVEVLLRSDDGILRHSLVDVSVALQKTRNANVDLNNKQLTLDFVHSANNDAASDDVTFNKRLAGVTQRFEQVRAGLHKRMQSLRDLQATLEARDAAVKQLQLWFVDQDAKLTRYQRIGHEASVKHALKECRAIQNELRAKERDIDRVKAMFDDVKSRHDTLAVVRDLNQSWADADHRTCQLRLLLEETLRHWESYHAAWEKVDRCTSDAKYALQLYKNASCDVTKFKDTINRVKVNIHV